MSYYTWHLVYMLIANCPGYDQCRIYIEAK